jgi:8-oxo-dGTP diphosphatase
MSPENKTEQESRPQVLLIHRALIQNANLILIIQRAQDDRYRPNEWELPGGKLEKGEDIYQALTGEVKEETGLEVEIIKPIAHVNGHLITEGPYTGLPYVGLTSVCQLTDNPHITLSCEHQAFRWVSNNEINNLNITPETKAALEALT